MRSISHIILFLVTGSESQQRYMHQGTLFVACCACCTTVSRIAGRHCSCCISADVWVKALFNHKATCGEEMSFVEGQLISVRSKQPNGVDDGWWIGESSGSTGLFPSMMVEELTPEALVVSDFISFGECCSHGRLQPVDWIITGFM